MDVMLINPFIDATIHVLSSMAFTQAHVGKPYRKKDNLAKGDVTGIVGLTGETRGTLSVSFSEDCILSIVSKMFGEEINEIDHEVKDAVGEILNIVSGQAAETGDPRQDSQGSHSHGNCRKEPQHYPHYHSFGYRHSLQY